MKLRTGKQLVIERKKFIQVIHTRDSMEQTMSPLIKAEQSAARIAAAFFRWT